MPKAPKHQWKVEVTTEGLSTMAHYEARNWGEGAETTSVEGTRPEQIKISRNGRAQFSIRILETGRLILTDYAGMYFEVAVPQNFTLNPAQPWTSRRK